MPEPLTANCHECRDRFWLGHMFWRGVHRYCAKCAKEYRYK